MAAEAPLKQDKQYPPFFCPIVLCGPPGIGKRTLLQRVKELLPNTIGAAVGYTTRKPEKAKSMACTIISPRERTLRRS